MTTTKVSSKALAFAVSAAMTVAKRHTSGDNGKIVINPDELLDLAISGSNCTLSAISTTKQANIWVTIPLAEILPLAEANSVKASIVAFTLDALVKTATGTIIEITDNGAEIVLKGDDRAKHKVKKFADAHDYMNIAGVTMFAAEFTGEEVLSLLRCAACTSEEEARHVLQSVLLDLGKEVVATAADGFRASVVTISPAKPVTKSCKLLLPPGFADALEKLVKPDCTMTLEVDKKAEHILATITTLQGYQIKLASPLASGNYPDVATIVANAKGNSHVFTAPQGDLASAVRRTKIFASHGQALSLEGDNGTLHLRAENSETGSCDNNLVDVKAVGDLNVALNARFLLDVVSDCKGIIEMRIGSGRAPVLITDNAGFTSVIMPLFVG